VIIAITWAFFCNVLNRAAAAAAALAALTCADFLREQGGASLGQGWIGQSPANPKWQRTPALDHPLPSAGLGAAQNVFPRRLPAIGFWAGIMDHVALPVQAGDEHRPAMVIATRLLRRKLRRLSPFRSHISQPLAEAAPAELRRAAEKINAIIRVIGRAEWLHRPKVLVTKRQNVAPHDPESSIPAGWQAQQL